MLGKDVGAGEAAIKPLAEMKRQHITRALIATDWRVSGPRGAAKILGLNPSTLRARMRKLGIDAPTAPAQVSPGH